MSKVIKMTGYRPLSHVIQTDDGNYYMVDSNDTFDRGFETMVFDWDIKRDEVSDWVDNYQELHDDYEEMEKRHHFICENYEVLGGR